MKTPKQIAEEVLKLVTQKQSLSIKEGQLISDLARAVLRLEQERDQWKDEYENLCKFATDYEQQRDLLRKEKAELTRKGEELCCVAGNLMRQKAELVKIILKKCTCREDVVFPCSQCKALAKVTGST